MYKRKSIKTALLLSVSLLSLSLSLTTYADANRASEYNRGYDKQDRYVQTRKQIKHVKQLKRIKNLKRIKRFKRNVRHEARSCKYNDNRHFKNYFRNIDQANSAETQLFPIKSKGVGKTERWRAHHGYRATVIKGLPVGVFVTGKAQPPKPSGDGTYFQIVDIDALENNELALSVADGVIGKLDLTITLFYDDSHLRQSRNWRGKHRPRNHSHSTIADAPAELKKINYRQSFNIKPTNNDMLFAQSGSVRFSAGDVTSTSTPLDIIVNPLLDDTGLVTISGFDENARLYDRNDNLIILSEFGSVELPISEITGLTVDVSEVTEEFILDVELNSLLNCRSVSASQEVFIGIAKFSEAANGDNQLLVSGSRDDYDVERVANSFVITERLNPSNVMRVDMVKAPHIRFDDGFVSSSDFVKSVNISGVTNQLGDVAKTLVIISNVPADAVINNSIALGNGVFAIPASDIQNGEIDIDYSLIKEEFTAEINVSAYAGTEEQVDFLNGQARVTGYANAEAFAEAGLDASLVVGPDGVSAEARASAAAGATGTAGGSVVVDGVGSVSSEVFVEAIVSAEVSTQFTISKDKFEQETGAEFEAGVTTGVNVSVFVESIPGTNADAEGTVGVSTFAKVGVNNELFYGDDQYGAGGEAEAEAGIMASATGYASGSLGGIGGNAEGGVSGGLGVGIGAGGGAKYDDGEITIGLSGELAVLVGIEFDVELVIDVNEVADTAELIGKGVITVVDAVEIGLTDVRTAMNDFGLDVKIAITKDLIPALEAIGDGFISGIDAIEDGLTTATEVLAEFGLDVADAVENGFMTAKQAVTEELATAAEVITGGLITATEAVEDGLISVSNAIDEGFITATKAVQDELISVGNAIGDGFISATDAVSDGLISAGDAISDGFISATAAVEGGLISVTNAVNSGLISATNAVNSGLISATAAVQGGLISVTNAVNSGLISATNAVNSGLISAADAIGGGLISGADAVAGGIISSADAVAGGFIDAGDAIGDVGDAIGDVGGGIIDGIGGLL